MLVLLLLFASCHGQQQATYTGLTMQGLGTIEPPLYFTSLASLMGPTNLLLANSTPGYALTAGATCVGDSLELHNMEYNKYYYYSLLNTWRAEGSAPAAGSYSLRSLSAKDMVVRFKFQAELFIPPGSGHLSPQTITAAISPLQLVFRGSHSAYLSQYAVSSHLTEGYGYTYLRRNTVTSLDLVSLTFTWDGGGAPPAYPLMSAPVTYEYNVSREYPWWIFSADNSTLGNLTISGDNIGVAFAMFVSPTGSNLYPVQPGLKMTSCPSITLTVTLPATSPPATIAQTPSAPPSTSPPATTPVQSAAVTPTAAPSSTVAAPTSTLITTAAPKNSTASGGVAAAGADGAEHVSPAMLAIYIVIAIISCCAFVIILGIALKAKRRKSRRDASESRVVLPANDWAAIGSPTNFQHVQTGSQSNNMSLGQRIKSIFVRKDSAGALPLPPIRLGDDDAADGENDNDGADSANLLNTKERFALSRMAAANKASNDYAAASADSPPPPLVVARPSAAHLHDPAAAAAAASGDASQRTTLNLPSYLRAAHDKAKASANESSARTGKHARLLSERTLLDGLYIRVAPLFPRKNTGASMAPLANSDEKLIMGRALAVGRFCVIYGATYRGADIALKLFTMPGRRSEDSLEIDRQNAELQMRLQLRMRNAHVIRTLGMYFDRSAASAPQYQVMELAHFGRLNDYLTHPRAHELVLDHIELTAISLQSAAGLAYLHSQGVIHRALSVYSVLVCKSERDDGRAIVRLGTLDAARKISWRNEDLQFTGSPEDVVPNDDDAETYPLFVKPMPPGKEIYIDSRSSMITPWASPEVAGRGVYSYASDCWSLGVLIFTIFSHGKTPLLHMRPDDIYEMYVALSNGARMLAATYLGACPPGCSSLVWQLIKSCCRREPMERSDAYSAWGVLEVALSQEIAKKSSGASAAPAPTRTHYEPFAAVFGSLSRRNNAAIAGDAAGASVGCQIYTGIFDLSMISPRSIEGVPYVMDTRQGVTLADVRNKMLLLQSLYAEMEGSSESAAKAADEAETYSASPHWMSAKYFSMPALMSSGLSAQKGARPIEAPVPDYRVSLEVIDAAGLSTSETRQANLVRLIQADPANNAVLYRDGQGPVPTAFATGAAIRHGGSLRGKNATASAVDADANGPVVYASTADALFAAMEGHSQKDAEDAEARAEEEASRLSPAYVAQATAPGASNARYRTSYHPQQHHGNHSYF